MKVVVIVPDRNITVDNKMLTLNDAEWTFDDSHIHAIHWDETSGELEFVDTSENLSLSSIVIVQPYIDKFFAELPKIEKLRMEREEQARAARETRENEIQAQKKEQENILRKIRETAEENRRLEAESRFAKQREDAAKAEKAQLEDKLRVEKELNERKQAREQLDAEIAAKTRLFDEEIEARTKSLAEVEESIIKNQQIAEDTLNELSKKLFQQKGELMSQVSDERAELDKQRQEFILHQEAARKEQELSNEILAQESEAVKERRQNENKHQEVENARLEVLEKELENERESLRQLSEIQHEQYAKDRDILEKDRILWSQENRARDESILLEIQRVEQEKKQLELDKHEYEMKVKAFDTQLQYEKDLIEARMRDELARRTAVEIAEREEEKLEDLEKHSILANKLDEIMSKTDPMDLFSLMGGTALDIQDLPIANMMAFFSQLYRMQEFCKKYNLTIKDIQNNEELENKFKEYLYDFDLKKGPEETQHQEDDDVDD